MIELARKTDIDTLLLRVEQRKRATRSSLSVEKILQYRDADRQ